MVAILNLIGGRRHEMSGNVDSLVENVGVKVEIASTVISNRSKVISTSGLVAAILNSGNQPMLGNTVSVRNVSSMVANVWVAVCIVLPAHCILQLFPRPVSVAAVLNSVCQCHIQVGPDRKSGGRC